MDQSTKTGVLVVFLSALGIFSHLLPHDMGISTVGAIGMLAAAYLPRWLALIPVVVTVFVSDLYVGFYGLIGMSFVYLAHVLATLAVQSTLKRPRALTVTGAAVLNACVFYAVSNLTPMALEFYPATLSGWLTCYANALPYLMKGILANLAFGGAAFGIIWLVSISSAYRLLTAQRH